MKTLPTFSPFSCCKLMNQQAATTVVGSWHGKLGVGATTNTSRDTRKSKFWIQSSVLFIVCYMNKPQVIWIDKIKYVNKWALEVLVAPVNPSIFPGILPYFTLLSHCPSAQISSHVSCVFLTLNGVLTKSVNQMTPAKSKKKNSSLRIQGWMNVHLLLFLMWVIGRT